MRISHVVKTLVLSDFFVNAGFSIFAPVFAVFVTKQINGGSLEVIGFAAAIFQVFKVLFQIPVARILDKTKGERDDFYSLIFGSAIISIVPFTYLLASEAYHIYIIQAIYGIGAAFSIPPWYAIFSRHMDKSRENVEWSMDSIAIGISGAGAAALGGFLAQRFSFDMVFVIGGIIAVTGASQQIRIFRDLKEKVMRGDVKPLPDRGPES
jgi:DHA1 family multidrug resistance protein-like MFS transporter